MSRMHVAESVEIAARPADVYTVISDYRQHHPRILPPSYFVGLEVAEGGIGAGTVMVVHMRALGQSVTYHMVASEPEPGRVLMETDHDQDVVTTFTVDPLAGGDQTRLTIATDWQPKSGLQGLADRLVTPMVMRRIYREELQRIGDYVRDGVPTVAN